MINADTIPALINLRISAARFFTILMWAHLPFILYMAHVDGFNWRSTLLVFLAIVSVPTILTFVAPGSVTTRLTMAVGLTAMPILFVFYNTGRLQIDFHMYFFAVFAMLAAFCDWRPIFIAAFLTSIHHLIFNFIERDRVFPTEGGIWRVGLHALMVALECGVLFWTITQMRKLFVNAERTEELATANAALQHEKERADQATAEKIESLERAALTDSLTQLHNHRAFYEDFEREKSRSRRYQRPLTLALIDVDDFKRINDSSGHQYGDKILMSLGELLQTLRNEDRAYRVGGDEFAILLIETDGEAAQEALERLQDDVRKSSLGTTLSIGYACLNVEEMDEATYELADTALYEAKLRGRNTIVGFEEIRDTSSVLSPRKAASVRRLVEEELLDVAFQPIWDTESSTVLGFEALARPHADLNLSGPEEAFDIAERIRYVLELDRLCVRKAFEAAKNLPKDATLFVNITPAYFEHYSFDPNAFVALLEKSGLRAQQVVVELTERRISDPKRLVERGAWLRTLGVRVALDDTGAGHAGLEILSKMQFDFVKIDRGLLTHALEDKGARGVLAGIIAIARTTGSYLIAEGIENQQLFDFACRAHGLIAEDVHGIRGAQGFLLGSPEIGHINTAALQQYGNYVATHRPDLHENVA